VRHHRGHYFLHGDGHIPAHWGALMACPCCSPCRNCCSCNQVLGLPPYEYIYGEDISYCGYQSWRSVDVPCTVSAIGTFAGSFPQAVVVPIFGPSAGFGWLKQSAIDAYANCNCSFAVLVSVQTRSNVSSTDNCGCIAYSITTCYNYKILKYLCDHTWQDVTEELLSEHRDCAPNNWPALPEGCAPKPDFPAIPDENSCDGPFTGCVFP
jgi:hypothetical protein